MEKLKYKKLEVMQPRINNKSGGGLKRDGGELINFLPLRKGALIRDEELISEGGLI